MENVLNLTQTVSCMQIVEHLLHTQPDEALPVFCSLKHAALCFVLPKCGNPIHTGEQNRPLSTSTATRVTRFGVCRQRCCRGGWQRTRSWTQPMTHRWTPRPTCWRRCRCIRSAPSRSWSCRGTASGCATTGAITPFFNTPTCLYLSAPGYL